MFKELYLQLKINSERVMKQDLVAEMSSSNTTGNIVL